MELVNEALVEETIKKEMLNNNMGYLTLSEVMDLLKNNDIIQWSIYRSVEREYHIEDIQNEIDFLNERREDNEEELIPPLNEDTLNMVLEDYECLLEDSEEWNFKLREALKRNEIINDGDF